MALRNWRWWHWLAVSLVVGGLLGLVLTSADPSDPSVPSDQFGAMRYKIGRKTDAGESVLTKIRVSPAVRDGGGKLVQETTFWERQKNKTTGTWDLTRQYRVITPVPLSPGSPSPNYGIMDFLAKQKTAIPSLDYQFKWWLVPRNVWALCLGGSVLLIGVAWPAVNRTLVAMGLGTPPDERAESLAAVRTVADTVGVPAGVGVTTDDRQRLADLNAELEANVAGLALTDAPKAADDAATVRPSVPEVRTLGGAAAEPATAAAVAAEGPGEFKGEFYPVARPVVKHSDGE